MSNTSNLTRYVGQSAVAAAALLVLGTGIALACSQPSCGNKCVAPVVHTSPAPKPSKTPCPTVAPKPVKTPCPTASPKPTVTPAPSKTPCPTTAPKPVKTPCPTPTPKASPTPVVTPTTQATPTATPTPVTGQVLSAQTTSLPDTGSALGSTSIGLGAMVSAGVTYIRSRRHK
jgi:outer membrane biosynthesis protein TonB